MNKRQAKKKREKALQRLFLFTGDRRLHKEFRWKRKRWQRRQAGSRKYQQYLLWHRLGNEILSRLFVYTNETEESNCFYVKS